MNLMNTNFKTPQKQLFKTFQACLYKKVLEHCPFDKYLKKESFQI